MFKRSMGALGLAVVGMAALGGGASAAVLFSDNFNAYTYNPAFTGTQPGTGLTVQAQGSVAGWVNSSNANALNALDRGNGNYAIMFYDGTVMYYGTPLAINDLGVTYTVSFTGSIAASSSASQVTVAGDYVQFLLNDATGTIASYQYSPSLTTTAFLPASFTYTGTGSGSVYLLIKDGLDSDGHFGGAIDDIAVSTAKVADTTSVPEPATLLLVGSGLIGAASLRRRKAAQT